MICTVVVPCYNEAARFPASTFRDYLVHNHDINFVLVNDGSKDGTLAVLHDLNREFPNRITVLDKKKNGGKGEAVRDGILQALKDPVDIVGFWDADLATPLIAISDLVQPLAANPQIQMVFGSRVKLMGRDIERKSSRHYLGRVFATVVSALLKLPIYDTQCGAKLFRANEDTARLFAGPFHSRWAFDVEILARFIQSRKGNMESVRQSIYEFPLYSWRDIAGSKVRPKDFVCAFADVLKIHHKYKVR